MKIVECVPNVSEGRDRSVLERIAAAVSAVEHVQLLDMDPGQETHRTVFTFIGPPAAVGEAAFQLTRTAAELIDMTRHSGAHARMGATDVVPFVPVGGGASMEDCIELANQVGRRVGEELGIPVYLYEKAATRPDRESLADVRRGEYEKLADKLSTAEGAPDYGPAEFVPRSGATAVGARPFLIAYNVDLNTSDRKLAHDIALDIREQGRWARDEDRKIVRDDEGNKVRKPGKHQKVRAVGWYIPEFGRAQVSINLTDFHVTPPHVVFESIREEARKRGLRVTGSEIVGLLPLEAMLAAGRFYLEAQGKSSAVPEPDLVEIARASLGLDDVKPFDPHETIIDYRLARRDEGMRGASLTAFADELSRSSPAPGGGSVAALTGALSGGLTSMVASLTHPGRDMDAETRRRLQTLGTDAQRVKDALLRAIDDDAAAFDAIGAARRLPRKTEEQQAAREAAIVDATRHAIEVPLSVVETSARAASLAAEIAGIGLAAAASDAGVAGWCARTAAEAAALNVRINLPGLPDAEERSRYEVRLEDALGRAREASESAVDAAEARLLED
jgi:glutamate formiminotransferase/formiminotetrahydrofolate cyclodeaminase